MNNETKASNRAHADTAIVSFSCPMKLREAIGHFAARDDRSLSSWIRKALEAAVARVSAKGGAR